MKFSTELSSVFVQMQLQRLCEAVSCIMEQMFVCFRANSTQHQTGVQATAETTTPGQCFPAG